MNLPIQLVALMPIFLMHIFYLCLFSIYHSCNFDIIAPGITLIYESKYSFEGLLSRKGYALCD